MSIYADDYDDAKRDVRRILLDGTHQKVYVEAWNGVGATALLREVAEEVEASEKREFDMVIKVLRPTPFRSRREIQRVVAEQLLTLLPPSVTAALDAADEHDDFNGEEDDGSRDLLPKVAEETYQAVKDRRVLLVLRNNIVDGKLIDTDDLGIPIARWGSRNAVLWTSGMNISREVASASAELIIRIRPSNETTALDLVYKEAVEIARYIDESSGGSLRTAPQLVLRCFWYCLLLCRAFNRSALLLDDGRPLEEAAAKYFVCDGILQGDAAWEIGRALAPVLTGCMVNDQLLQFWDETFSTWMPSMEKKELLPPKALLVDSITQGDWVKFSSPSEEEEKEIYRWISVRSTQNNDSEPWDFFFKVYRSSVMSGVSSFFGHFEKETPRALPDGFFDHFTNVRVLALLGCIVSPINSSFLRLRNLRMLRLERCKVTSPDPNSHSSARGAPREPILFDRLWVLNLCNLDADKFLLAGKAFELMPNLRVLDLTDCEGLEYLNFNLPTTIETISLRRCASLKEVELVDPAAAPLPNLKTFQLSGSKLIAKLSLQGCRKLENIDLQELMGLEVLDLSCTAIKVVDISKLPQLKQLFLLGCERLHRVASLYLGQELDVLYLDNYNSSSACDVDRCFDSFRNQRQLTNGTNDADQRLFHAHVVVRDARLLRSLGYAFPDLSRAKSCFHIHVKGSSTTERGINIGTTTRSNATIPSALCYADVLNTITDHHRRHHPSPPTMPLKNHIEVDGGHDSRIVEYPFCDITEFANSLFIHDNTFNFAMKTEFRDLKCFRIERCPNLLFILSRIYSAPDSLETIWLSQLPRLKALHDGGRIGIRQLKHIYLEFCTRLEYVLPSLSVLHDLETINIRFCGDLTAIFKSDDDNKDKSEAAPKLLLPNLKSIHLQELPKLQHIYKSNIHAPSLEELKIMGCFNLKKLPLFGRSDARSMRAVKISCEKDWWDKLQWDGLESNHHSSLFDPKYCPHYKKPMKATYLL